MKTLLVLSGGKESIAGIKLAKQMGIKVVVCDGDENAPGRSYSDDFICASIYHPDQIVEALKKYKKKDEINGVITIAADNPLSVAKSAKYLGLDSLSETTAILSTNKLLMKEVLEKANIPIPWYKGINNIEELKQIIQQRPGKYVLKPVDSRGSRGVIRVSSLSECNYAYSYSLEYSQSNQLILEEWLEGFQVSTESLVWEYESYLCGIADRNYSRLESLYPYVVEDGGETPSRFSTPDLEEKINDLITKVAKTINLEKGSLKGDIVLTEDGPKIIEFASRLSGGFFSTHTIPIVYGVDLISNVIKIALGQEPEFPPSPLKVKKWQANRFLFLEEGKITSITGLPKDDSDIVIFDLYIKTGDRIKKLQIIH